MDFVEICNVCAWKPIIKVAERMFNSDKIWRSYSDFYFGVTFLEHSVYCICCIWYKTERFALCRCFAVVMDCLEWVCCPFCHSLWLQQHLQVVWFLPSCCSGTSKSKQMQVVNRTRGFWYECMLPSMSTTVVHCLALSTDLKLTGVKAILDCKWC